jgi:hypothetical protein
MPLFYSCRYCGNVLTIPANNEEKTYYDNNYESLADHLEDRHNLKFLQGEIITAFDYLGYTKLQE